MVDCFCKSSQYQLLESMHGETKLSCRPTEDTYVENPFFSVFLPFSPSLFWCIALARASARAFRLSLSLALSFSLIDLRLAWPVVQLFTPVISCCVCVCGCLNESTSLSFFALPSLPGSALRHKEVQPVVFQVSFFQSRIPIDSLVLLVSCIPFRRKETKKIEIGD